MSKLLLNIESYFVDSDRENLVTHQLALNNSRIHGFIQHTKYSKPFEKLIKYLLCSRLFSTSHNLRTPVLS